MSQRIIRIDIILIHNNNVTLQSIRNLNNNFNISPTIMNKKSLLTMITLLMVAISASAVKLNDIITKDGITYLVSSVNDYSKEAIVSVRKPESGKYSGAISIPNRFLTSTDGVSWECQVTSVLNNAFAGSDITSITLPSNINDIQEGSFANCLKLTSYITKTVNFADVFPKGDVNGDKVVDISDVTNLVNMILGK